MRFSSPVQKVSRVLPTPDSKITLYTIGHSNHTADAFVALLQSQGITQLADVRSQPFSRYNPQFNKDALASALKLAGITYIFMGDTLGGRPDQADLYDPGHERPNYGRQRQTPLYQQGISRLLELASTPTAMMCSEGDPLDCHRTLLIVPSLLERDVTVLHIYPDGHLEIAEMPMEQLGFGF